MIDLHAVCVGTIETIAPGKRSAIDKHPVRADVVRVTELGLEGDEQQEAKRLYFGRQLHGGPDKAVHAYPHEHLPVWSEIAEREVLPGNLGENLSIGGVLNALELPYDRFCFACFDGRYPDPVPYDSVSRKFILEEPVTAGA